MPNVYRLTEQAATAILLQKARPVLREKLSPGRRYSCDDIRRILHEAGVETTDCELDPVVAILVNEGILELVPED